MKGAAFPANWSGGQLMAFSGLDGTTDYKNGLVARTILGATGLELKLPGELVLVFSRGKPGRAVLTGDFFDIEVPEGRVRGAFLDACHFLVEGPCESGKSDGRIEVLGKGGKTLVGSAAVFNPRLIDSTVGDAINKRSHWLESLTIPGERDGEPLRKALSIMKTQVCSPEGGIKHRWTTPDRWPHRAMWLWDSAFHAIGWRNIDLEVAHDALMSVLDTAQPDGFIPHMASPDSVSGITQPPVLAMAAAMVNETAPDREWLGRIYPRLRAYVEWDLANRDTDGAGLAEWTIEGDPDCRSGESGMDNSPRFDSAIRLDAVDFNSFLALECETLERFAVELGRKEDAGVWRERHARLVTLINDRLWDEKAGFYFDYDVQAGKRIPVLACSGFMPLACGVTTPERARKLAEHLDNPATFGVLLRVPSVATGERSMDEKDMWRGPVWINMNWLIVRGLRRYGLEDAASKIESETIEEIERQYGKYGVFFEYYDGLKEIDPPSLKRKGKCDPASGPYHQVIHDYGWTASLYVDLLLGNRLKLA